MQFHDEPREKNNQSDNDSSFNCSENSGANSVQAKIKKLKSEVYKTKVTIHNSRTKKIGIKYNEIRTIDKKISFLTGKQEKNFRPEKI